jgi:hypothetical protein
MLNAQFRPLASWPGERTRDRKSAQFRATYEKTLDLLEDELGKLRARDVIIQVDNLALADIRNDGWPRGGWQPRGGNQGVIVSFDSPKGSMSFPCDRFSEWRDNLRAIGLGLEALRAVDRYGVTRGNEQYRGWSRLEAPGSNGIVKMDRDTAISLIEALTGHRRGSLNHFSSQDLKAAVRLAKQANHPDHGTSEADKAARHDTFVKIGEAERALGL